jgi:uncharacterized protein YjbI with pentapeptide repeats
MLNTKIIGQKITEARKHMNISQAQLAQLLFISSQAVGKWERGESMPDILTLNRLAGILGVDLNYFSENVQSAHAEMPPAGSLGEQSAVISSDIASLDSLNAPQSLSGNQKKLNWDMSNGNWVDADFSGLKNLQEKFGSSNMKNCLFVGSDLSGLILESNHIDSCDFSGSDISNSHLRGSSLVNNSWKHCFLEATEFSGSYIKSCDFSGANFTDAVFRAGDFRHNTMVDAVWNRTSFQAMHLADLVFDGTWEDCSFENCAFSRVTFQNATLTNTFFKGKSLKRIRFVECQADPLTYAFLKNGKADLTGITLVTA